jgi:hypothetical protein
VVVTDNVSWHNSQRVQDIIEGYGARLVYTPVASPALNPIELAFYKFAARCTLSHLVFGEGQVRATAAYAVASLGGDYGNILALSCPARERVPRRRT